MMPQSLHTYRMPAVPLQAGCPRGRFLSVAELWDCRLGFTCFFHKLSGGITETYELVAKTNVDLGSSSAHHGLVQGAEGFGACPSSTANN
ncbi:hypothetical protein CBM2631_A320018 [Cupriavidus taiwanensis]|nr:hypothetical protein CBM2631_A320018 [Cupriavidus taiwanensis]